ncbi:hypothetical protein PVAND_012294 [Polypedilum vanderplanki]|uniref:Cerebellar degeneration-related protein 2-like protein n=1 Tax=Polypedilum vanderplanki TaxID=319348 RepID=A0A9J6CM06_POLVA|nr:hypothetical protein PVAND_012294 [Polypedilum vanderplanki]
MELNESNNGTQSIAPVVINDKKPATTNNSPQKNHEDSPIFSRMNSMECWDYTIELECLNGPQDLQLAAELGKTLLERNKELENLLRAHQRKCEDQKQEIEYLTKQNLALKEVNDTRMQIYESLDISIHDLEREKHQLTIENSLNKKHIKELNETLEKLEQKCEELTKQYEDVKHILEQERRKHEKNSDSISNVSNSSSSSSSGSNFNINNASEFAAKAMPIRESSRHNIGSASEPENDEASTPTNPSKSFTNSGQMSVSQTTTPAPFMNYSHDFSSIQPIYSHDSLSHDSGFKTGSTSSNCADHEELLKVLSELEESKQQNMNAQMTITELEQQISVLSHENSVLQNRIVQSNTLDEMKSVHEELSFLEEVRQGQLCTRCLKSYDDRMTDNTSYIGTEGDEDDRSLMDLLNETTTNPLAIYRSAVTIKDNEDESSSQCENEESNKNESGQDLKVSQYNPYKELVEKYEALLEIQRNSRPKPQQQQQQQAQPQSLQDELNSTDFSSLNTKYTAEDEKKIGARHKTPTDFSEIETSSSGFSDEISSTKATQTDNSSFLFSIVDGEDCKFSIYDDASSAPIETRFRERPQYRDLFKEIFTVLKKAAENKEEGETLPLLDDNEKTAVPEVSNVPPVTPATETIPPCKDFDLQSVMSSAISENSIAVSECITKTERKKAKSHKKQAAKEELENKPPSVVQVVGGKLVTPYNRLALDFAALNAKKRARRSRHRSKDKYGTSGRDSSVCSNASSCASTSDQITVTEAKETKANVEKSPLTPTKMKKLRRPRELLQLQTLSTMPTVGGEWNGDTLTIYNKNAKMSSNNPTGFYCRPTVSTDEIQFKASAASHELRKLKKLDLSYAEVLKHSDRKFRSGHRHK